MTSSPNARTCVPQDHENALLIGRVWQPGVGPVLVRVDGDDVYDLSRIAPTCSQLLERDDPAALVRAATDLPRIASLQHILAVDWDADAADVGDVDGGDDARWRLLASCDLQAIKASGVTFVASMLERVIEEAARGDASRADEVRRQISAVIGNDLASVVPGSGQSKQLKEVLIRQGVWSQYLEVGIGPDAEIFTKAQPMSALGSGAEIGIHPASAWNNPEPEVVLAVDSRGRVLGASLGNDVNLRDFEGRSALLLGKAKDNNGSCAIGPFIRLFDAAFGIEDVRKCHLVLQVSGADGFLLRGSSSMTMISRDPLSLVQHAMGPNHQYPDGMMLFLGTMFAPTQDRDGPGQGFTHKTGDVVSISAPQLGTLVNRVNYSDRIPPWTFGLGALMQNLAQRKLI